MLRNMAGLVSLVLVAAYGPPRREMQGQRRARSHAAHSRGGMGSTSGERIARPVTASMRSPSSGVYVADWSWLPAAEGLARRARIAGLHAMAAAAVLGSTTNVQGEACKRAVQSTFAGML